jgi:molybdate transport system ATP-binding protein
VSDKLLAVSLTHTLHTVHGTVEMEVAFTLAQGKVLAVTGESGAGKTTLLRILAGLIKPERGAIRKDGATWFDSGASVFTKTQHRGVGMVFQDYALFPHWTVRQNLEYALKKGQSGEWVDGLLRQTELISLADRKPGQLSGGQQQRVALARTLVQKPDLLLLDEPLSALDREMRMRMQNLLLDFQQKMGFSLILVTHDLAEIFRLADEVVVLKNGRIEKAGTPTEVYAQEPLASGTHLLVQVVSCRLIDDQVELMVTSDGILRKVVLPAALASEVRPGNELLLNFNFGGTKIISNFILP